MLRRPGHTTAVVACLVVGLVVSVGTFSALSALLWHWRVLPVVVRALVQALELVVRGSIWLATATARGDNTWTIVTAVGRGLTAALITPGALGVVGGLLLLGALALFGLQRLLDSEEQEESLR